MPKSKDELNEEIENLSYENKKMAEFLEFVGIKQSDISEKIIQGDKKSFEYLMKDFFYRRKRKNSVIKD